VFEINLEFLVQWEKDEGVDDANHCWWKTLPESLYAFRLSYGADILDHTRHPVTVLLLEVGVAGILENLNLHSGSQEPQGIGDYRTTGACCTRTNRVEAYVIILETVIVTQVIFDPCIGWEV